MKPLREIVGRKKLKRDRTSKEFFKFYSVLFIGKFNNYRLRPDLQGFGRLLRKYDPPAKETFGEGHVGLCHYQGFGIAERVSGVQHQHSVSE